MDLKSKIILIYGPTASGKSEFAIKLAKKIKGEIVNTDSMQVYKDLKILTARPLKKNLFKTLRSYLKVIEDYEADHILCIGTAAFRDAENSNDVVEEVKKKFDLDLQKLFESDAGLKTTRNYEGCNHVEGFFNEESSKYVVIQHWDSFEQYNAYADWRFKIAMDLTFPRSVPFVARAPTEGRVFAVAINARPTSIPHQNLEVQENLQVNLLERFVGCLPWR